jgi:hypothetical protein
MRQAKYLVISSLLIIPLSLSLNVKAQIAANANGPFSASVERRTAEQNLRSLPMKLRERRTQKTYDPQLLERMNEDFVRIQSIRLELVREIAAGKSFGLRRLENDAREIRKRAARLKDSLELLENQVERSSALERKQFIQSSINDAAFDLCLEISRFIENPIFGPKGVYTVRDAADAVRSLDTVIDLAASIGESAERLRRSN